MDYVKELSKLKDRNLQLVSENETLNNEINVLKKYIDNIGKQRDETVQQLALLKVLMTEYEQLCYDLKNKISSCQVLEHELGNLLNTSNMIKKDIEDDSFVKYKLI